MALSNYYSCSLPELMFTNGSTAIDASVANAAALGEAAEATGASRFARALEVPECATVEQEEQREDRELAARDLPLTSIPVVPREDECYEQPMSSARPGSLWTDWPVEESAESLQ